MAELHVEFAEPGKLRYTQSHSRPNIVWAHAEHCVDADTGELSLRCLDLINSGREQKIKVVLLGSASILGSIRDVARLPVALIPKPDEEMSDVDTSNWLKEQLGYSLRSRASSGEARVRTARAERINPHYLTEVLSLPQRKSFFAAVREAQVEDAGLSSNGRATDRTKTTAEAGASVAQAVAFAERSAKAGA